MPVAERNVPQIANSVINSTSSMRADNRTVKEGQVHEMALVLYENVWIHE